MVSVEELKQQLLSSGVLDEGTLAQASERAEKVKNPLEDVLVDEGFLNELTVGRVVADIYKIPFVNLREKILDPGVVRRVPEALARNKNLVLYDLRNGSGYLAMAYPKDPETINAISRRLGISLEVAYATRHMIAETHRHYQRELYEAFAELITRSTSTASSTVSGMPSPDLPVAQIVDTLVRHAYQSLASDVHLEPMVEDVAVRFRIDGVLHDVVPISRDLYDLVVARIKVLARLRTDEHLAAQDGKIQTDVGEENLDIRVSVLPTAYGEKVVMRLLSQKQRRFTLEDLGFRKEDLQKVREAILRPHGMILATGPTGSGKTTTLYAILQALNTREVNITTIEDPIEYHIDGVNQVQINPRTNLTFAHGLRSILRQDPDIIMVGEIRDEETAAISVNAALTGHLVLSTLHTNDAPTTLPRLLDMKVEPFLVASSVNIAMGQRLVRKVCQQCVMSAPLTTDNRDLILRLLPPQSALKEEAKGRPRVFVGKGCPFCHGTGFKGRAGIYEILVLDEPIRELIVQKASADALKRSAQERGMTTMIEDGIRKVFQGVTTVEEVLGATQE